MLFQTLLYNTAIKSKLFVITGAAFRRTFRIPTHTHHIFPGVRSGKEKSTLGIHNIPFAINADLIPLMTRINGFGICMYIFALDSDSITERFHGSGKTRTLSFVVNEGSPCIIGIVVLPAASRITAVASQIKESSKSLIILAHSLSDIIGFETLNNSSNLHKLAGIQ